MPSTVRNRQSKEMGVGLNAAASLLGPKNSS